MRLTSSYFCLSIFTSFLFSASHPTDYFEAEEKGSCVALNGAKLSQNAVQLDTNNDFSVLNGNEEECLKKCYDVPSVTACEMKSDSEERGCYAYTDNTVNYGSMEDGSACYLLKNPLLNFGDKEDGYCVKIDGQNIADGVTRLTTNDVGGDHGGEEECLALCDAIPGVTACLMIRDQGNRGCYSHTSDEVYRGNDVDKHLCYIRYNPNVSFENKQNGSCAKVDGTEITSGVQKLKGGNFGGSYGREDQCMSLCETVEGFTACEMIWDEADSGCYAHTSTDVNFGNLGDNDSCYPRRDKVAHFKAQQQGYCVGMNNENIKGAYRISSEHFGGDFGREEECLEMCDKVPGLTACQMIWGQGNSGCYALTSDEAVRGNGRDKHYCYIRPDPESHFEEKELGSCVAIDGNDIDSGINKLMGGNFGGDYGREDECLELCDKFPGVTGCEMLWNQDNRGCYVHTSDAVSHGNKLDGYSCYRYRDPVKQFDERADGYCTNLKGEALWDSMIKLTWGDYGGDYGNEEHCLDLCDAFPGATACQMIWDQGNRGCYAHTSDKVFLANGMNNNYCYLKPNPKIRYEDEEEGSCVTVEGDAITGGMQKLMVGDVGGPYGGVSSCLSLCEDIEGYTGCEMIWGNENRGCYVYTNSAVSYGDKSENHICYVRRGSLAHFEEQERGYCVAQDGSDVNEGVIRLTWGDFGGDYGREEECLQKCDSIPNITACEMISDRGNRGCYAHTNEQVFRGNGVKDHYCYLRPHPKLHFQDEEKGACTVVDGSAVTSGVQKLKHGNFGGPYENEEECLNLCDNVEDYTACEMIWDQENKGCYAHTSMSVNYGNGIESKSCYIRSNALMNFGEQEKGYCVTTNNEFPHETVVRLTTNDVGGDHGGEEECLALCDAIPGVTACQMIWDQGNRGCYAHKSTEIVKASGVDNHACYFRPKPEVHFDVEEGGACTAYDGSAIITGVLKLKSADFGGPHGNDRDCLNLCDRVPGYTACEMVWDNEDRGCYVYTSDSPNYGNLADSHSCYLRKDIFAKFDEEKNGYCVEANGQFPHESVKRLNYIDVGGGHGGEEECLQLCDSVPGVTACQMIWDQGNRGCYAHTSEAIFRANGVAKHSCYLRPRPKLNFHREEKGACTTVDGSAIIDGVQKLKGGNFGGAYGKEEECLNMCDNIEGYKACGMIWDEDARGCYVYTTTSVNDGNLEDNHSCYLKRNAIDHFEEPLEGYCLKSDGVFPTDGLSRLSNVDVGGPYGGEEECLDMCDDIVGVTACQMIWAQGNRGCYAHTHVDVSRASGSDRHKCYLRPQPKIHFVDAEEGACAAVDGSEITEGLQKLKNGNFGGPYENEAECLNMCDNVEGFTACQMVWDHEDNGCYVYTTSDANYGNLVDNHSCYLKRNSATNFEEQALGFCVTGDGTDVNENVLKLMWDNIGGEHGKEQDCLDRCDEIPGTTACEMIWDQGNRGCYAHKSKLVSRANGAIRHYCYVRSNPKPHFMDEAEKGACSAVDGSDITDGVQKLKHGDFGGLHGREEECLNLCDNVEGYVACGMIWDEVDKGCYAYTNIDVNYGDLRDNHSCHFRRNTTASFEDKSDGYCVKTNGQYPDSGTFRLHYNNVGGGYGGEENCLELCDAVPGVTACQMIWDQGNRGCYAHTDSKVARATGTVRHSCYFRHNPTLRFQEEEKGACTTVDGKVINDGVIKLKGGDFGGSYDREAECLGLCENVNDYTACEMIWDDENRGCYAHISTNVNYGNLEDKHECHKRRDPSSFYEERENGYCAKTDGQSTSEGLIRLSFDNVGGDYGKEEECLVKCDAVTGVTACMMIWDRGNRGCYAHTSTEVVRGSGNDEHYCYMRQNPVIHYEQQLMEGSCVAKDDSDVSSGVIKLQGGDFGGHHGREEECLHLCNSVDGMTACEMIWNQDDRGCYVHTSDAVHHSSDLDGHRCFLKRHARRHFEGRERGYCVNSDGADVNEGAIRLIWGDFGGIYGREEECLEMCDNMRGVTACEMIRDQGNRGCWAHTSGDVHHGNFAGSHLCFLRRVPKKHFDTGSTGFCADWKGQDINDDVFQLSKGNFGNDLGNEDDCLALCDAYAGVTGCEMIQNKHSSGCYAYTAGGIDHARQAKNQECYKTVVAAQLELAPPPIIVNPGRCGGRASNWWGDPHLVTFDGLRFDCQGVGEFTMLASMDSVFEIQSRFEGIRENSPVTVTTSLVIKTGDPDTPTIQVNVPANPESGCGYDFFVDGVPRDIFTIGTGSANVMLYIIPQHVTERNPNGRKLFFYYPATGLRIEIFVSQFAGKCVMSQSLCLPYNYRRSERFIGLLGSPTESQADDWMARDGTIIPYNPDRQTATDYCIQHWCIFNEADSLFAYEEGESFDDHLVSCSDAYVPPVFELVIPPEVLDVCGDDIACQLEGAEGGIFGALEALEIEEEATMIIREAPPTDAWFDPREEGECVDIQNVDVNEDILLLVADDFGGSHDRVEECLKLCDAVEGVTACEMVWGGNDKGCYAHKSTRVDHGNKVNRHYCYMRGHERPEFEAIENGACVSLNGFDIDINVVKLAEGNFGGPYGRELECLEYCDAQEGLLACQMTWDTEMNNGCFAHSDPAINRGDGKDNHFCFLKPGKRGGEEEEQQLPNYLYPSVTPTDSPTMFSNTPTISLAPTQSRRPSEAPSVDLDKAEAPVVPGDYIPEELIQAAFKLENGIVQLENGIVHPEPEEQPEPEDLPGEYIGRAFGDPHLQTWTGQRYDFHGLCDLVLLKNPSFRDGLGMNIHMRTKKTGQWSYISSAVLSIGNHTLEVMSDHKGGMKYWINAQENIRLEDGGGLCGDGVFPMDLKQLFRHQWELSVSLNHQHHKSSKIIFSTFKSFVNVEVSHPMDSDFRDSLGLMGQYRTGLKLGRDSSTLMDEDMNAFGQEWQVQANEPMYFHNIDGPQAPKRCDIPSVASKTNTVRRRLGEQIVSEDEAKSACAAVNGKDDFDACVFDVLATNDMEMSLAYHQDTN